MMNHITIIKYAIVLFQYFEKVSSKYLLEFDNFRIFVILKRVLSIHSLFSIDIFMFDTSRLFVSK